MYLAFKKMGSVSFPCQTEAVGVAQGYMHIACNRASI